MVHFLLLTCAIWMTSANITPILSLSDHLSKLREHPHAIYHSQPLIQKPNQATAASFHYPQTPSSRHLLQLPDVDILDFLTTLRAAVAAALPTDIADFYEEETDDGADGILIITVGLEALIEAELDPDAVDIDQVADDIANLLIAAFDNPECTDLITDFLDVVDAFRRRRLSMLDIQAEISVAADSHVETFGDFFEFVFGATIWELTEEELLALQDVELGDFLGFLFFVPYGVGLAEVIEGECDAEQASVLEAVPDSLEIYRDFLGIISDEGDAGDDDESDSGSDESGDDARTVNEEQDNLDLDGVGEEGGDGGLEVVTLRIATSTMTNIWIIFIVFCGFNMSLCCCLMGRKKKESVQYETAEERPSISVDRYHE